METEKTEAEEVETKEEETKKVESKEAEVKGKETKKVEAKKIDAKKVDAKKVETGNRNLRKERIGLVTSNKMDKSIAVEVQRKVKHAKYGKFVKRSKKFIAHDEKNECSIGDTVRIMETRPISKSKCWRMVEVIEKVK